VRAGWVEGGKSVPHGSAEKAERERRQGIIFMVFSTKFDPYGRCVA
jgi:hypothetical protein